MTTMYVIVPEEALTNHADNTRTRDPELAKKLAEQETAHWGIPHTVETVEVQR